MAMAMAVDSSFELEISGHSTTASSADIAGNWSDWSPVVDWEALTTNHDDFHNWIESDCMIEDEELNSNFNLTQTQSNETSNSASVSTDTTTENDETFSDDSKGLRLIHLLLAAAEALAGENNSRELARVILARLKEMVSPIDGTNMERLAAYFSDALYGLLENSGKHNHRDNNHRDNNHHHHRADVLAAFQLLQDMSPYVKFAHFTANQAILEAVAKDQRIHIIDYDIMDGIQWASLMQSLVSRKDGTPAPHLRITAVTRGGGGGDRRSIGTIQETGRRLAGFAASIGQPFSFHQCRLNPDETFRPGSLKLVKGEALVINCTLHLPHSGYRAPDSIASFLSGSKGLNPRIVTLVEEEVGPVSERMFVERFMDYLQHYSALFDSLEAGFPMQNPARALVEKVFLGPRIFGSLGRIYGANGEEWSSLGEWLGVVGYTPVNISFANHCQAKLLLGLFNDGYRVEELSSNRLVLGWKSRRLLSASVWTSPSSDQFDL